VVAVDPSAPFAVALSDVLPHATLVLDHRHLHPAGEPRGQARNP